MKTRNILLPFYFIFCFTLFARNTCAQISGDTITFENGVSNIYIDTLNSNNIWQVGKPQKILFDSAYTKPNAIITDSLNPYPNNNTSSFVVKIVGYWAPNWPGPFPTIEFTHKYNTDTIVDGGHIEYSFDAGINWQPVQNYGEAYFSSSTAPYFSGTINQWKKTTIVFYPTSYSGMLDSILIKFIFTTDGINTNKEGWMIDNIFYGTIIGEGIETHNSLNFFNIWPNPNNGTFNLIMNNVQGITNYKVTIYNIFGEKIYSNSKLNKKTSNEIDLSTFHKGIYFINIFDGEIIHSKKIVVQ